MSVEGDGVDQSITLGTGVNFSGANDGGSVGIWFRVASITDARCVAKDVGLNDNDMTFMLGITTVSSGTVRGNLDGIALDSVETIALNVWHHLLITYDGTTIRLYFNGVEVDTAAHAGNIASDARVTRLLSSGADTTARALDGEVTDAELWDEGLTASEVKSICAHRGRHTISRSRRYRWPLNENGNGVIGASAIKNTGPVSLADGSGTNSPVWSNQNLSINQMVI